MSQCPTFIKYVSLNNESWNAISIVFAFLKVQKANIMESVGEGNGTAMTFLFIYCCRFFVYILCKNVTYQVHQRQCKCNIVFIFILIPRLFEILYKRLKSFCFISLKIVVHLLLNMWLKICTSCLIRLTILLLKKKITGRFKGDFNTIFFY